MATTPGIDEPGVSLSGCQNTVSGFGISAGDASTICATLNTSTDDNGIQSYITPTEPDVTTVSVNDLPQSLQTTLSECDGTDSCNLVSAKFDTDGTVTTTGLSGSSYAYDAMYTSGDNSSAIIKIETYDVDQFGIPLTKKNAFGSAPADTWNAPILLTNGAPLGYTYDDYETFTGANSGTTTVANSLDCSAQCDAATGTCIGFNYNQESAACVLFNAGATKNINTSTMDHAYSKITIPPSGTKQLSDLVSRINMTPVVELDVVTRELARIFGPTMDVLASGAALDALSAGLSISNDENAYMDDNPRVPSVSGRCSAGWHKINNMCYEKCKPGMQRGTGLTAFSAMYDEGYIGRCYTCGLATGDPIFRDTCNYYRAYGGPVCAENFTQNGDRSACVLNCGSRQFPYMGSQYCCPVSRPNWTEYLNICCPNDTYLGPDWVSCIPVKEYVMQPEIAHAISGYAFQTTEMYPKIKTSPSGVASVIPVTSWHVDGPRHWDDDGQTCADVNACNVSIKRLLDDPSVTSFMTDDIKACRGCTGRGAKQQSDGTWYVWYEKALSMFTASALDYTPSGAMYTSTIRSVDMRLCEPPRIYIEKTPGYYSNITTYKEPGVFYEPCSRKYSKLYVTGVATKDDLRKMVWYKYKSNTYTEVMSIINSSTPRPIDCVVTYGKDASGSRSINYVAGISWNPCPASGCAFEQTAYGYISQMPQNGGRACPPLVETRTCTQIDACTSLAGYANGSTLIWYIDGRGQASWMTDLAKYGTVDGEKSLEKAPSPGYKIFKYDNGNLYPYDNPLFYIYASAVYNNVARYPPIPLPFGTKLNPDMIKEPITWNSYASDFSLKFKTYTGTPVDYNMPGLLSVFGGYLYSLYVENNIPYVKTQTMRDRFPEFILNAMTRPATIPSSEPICKQDTVLDYGATIRTYNNSCVPTCILNGVDPYAASVSYIADGNKCEVSCTADTTRSLSTGRCNKTVLSASMSFAAGSTILHNDEASFTYDAGGTLSFRNTVTTYITIFSIYRAGKTSGYRRFCDRVVDFDNSTGILRYLPGPRNFVAGGSCGPESSEDPWVSDMPRGSSAYGPFTLEITLDNNLVVKDRDGIIAWKLDANGGHNDRRAEEDAIGERYNNLIYGATSEGTVWIYKPTGWFVNSIVPRLRNYTKLNNGTFVGVSMDGYIMYLSESGVWEFDPKAKWATLESERTAPWLATATIRGVTRASASSGSAVATALATDGNVYAKDFSDINNLWTLRQSLGTQVLSYSEHPTYGYGGLFIIVNGDNCVWEYGGSWVKISNGTVKYAIYYAADTIIGVGGGTGSSNSTLWELNRTTSTWTQLPNSGAVSTIG